MLVRQRRVHAAGAPDVVYLVGSFDYNQSPASNGRGVLLSTDGGATWSDLTQDGDPHHAEFTHPDQHAIVTNPNNPFQYWEGSDGGVVRSDGKFADVSYKCDSRGLTTADTAYCKSLLSRVPNELTSLNKGLSTLQFQSLSVSRSARRTALRAARRTTARSSTPAPPSSGRRSSTATAASPASTPPTTTCGSTRSRARRTT